MKGRILAVDYGERRVGLALSDPLGITAQGLETVEVNSLKEAISTIKRLLVEHDVKEVVVGHPRNMDGTEGEAAVRVSRFAHTLERETGLRVKLWDERLTSVAALRAMHEMDVKIKGRKGKLDSIAATMILQSYLNFIRRDRGG